MSWRLEVETFWFRLASAGFSLASPAGSVVAAGAARRPCKEPSCCAEPSAEWAAWGRGVCQEEAWGEEGAQGVSAHGPWQRVALERDRDATWEHIHGRELQVADRPAATQHRG